MGKIRSTKKIITIIATAFLAILLFITPIVISAAVVATPVVVINNIFQSIGDFVFGDGEEDNEVIELIEKYFSLPETKESIRETYQPLIDEEKKVDIPLHWLVIPNLLAGIEEVTPALVRKQIKCMKKEDGLRELESYVNELRKEEPWKTGFGSVSTTTIVGYINQFTSYLGQEDSLDVGNLKGKEFAYPLKERALVTSEFGGREGVAIDPQNFHYGIDLAYAGGAPKTCGVPIYAVQDGVVAESDQSQYGRNYFAGANGGIIRYENVDVWYIHERDPFPYAPGEKIKKGQFVGYIGKSGRATGCHLHLEIHVDGKAVNPRNFIEF